MKPDDASLVYRRIRAPVESGHSFVDPPLSETHQLFARNRQQRLSSDVSIGGMPLSALSRQAQREFLELALRFTCEYKDIREPVEPRELALVLSGHQPQLYHPGVWFKNFLVSSVARQIHAWGINVIIDSDTLRTASIRVPGGDLASPILTTVPFDDGFDEIPFEERTVRDFGTWAGFSCRVRRELARHIPDPLICRFWPWATSAAHEAKNLGLSLCRARHLIESEWGLETLEAPLSLIARTPSFLRFAWHLFTEIALFQRVHNQALAEYRQVHRIRGHLHPLPDLGADSRGTEAPFWVWRENSPQRHKVYLQPTAEGLKLTDGFDGTVIVVLKATGDEGTAIEQLTALATSGWRLRPRALVTTMYMRMVLSDLFVHGIGGAKYDQVTDLIVNRFFGYPPPSYMTATATVQLPISVPNVTQADVQSVERELRDLRFVPERYLASQSNLPAAVKSAMDEKRAWVGRDVPHQGGKERYRAIRDATERMHSFVRSQRDELRSKHQRMVELSSQRALLSSREFAFPLFPERFLRPLLLELSAFAP